MVTSSRLFRLRLLYCDNAVLPMCHDSLDFSLGGISAGWNAISHAHDSFRGCGFSVQALRLCCRARIVGNLTDAMSLVFNFREAKRSFAAMSKKGKATMQTSRAQPNVATRPKVTWQSIVESAFGSRCRVSAVGWNSLLLDCADGRWSVASS